MITHDNNLIFIAASISIVIATTITLFFATPFSSPFALAQATLSAIDGALLLPPQAPTGRENFGLSCQLAPAGDAYLWVVGGRDSSGALADIYEFNIDTTVWTRHIIPGLDKDVVNFHLIASEWGADDPQLLVALGEQFSTGDPVVKVQAWDGIVWEEVDAGWEIPSFLFASFNLNKGEWATDKVGAIIIDGIAKTGYEKYSRVLTYDVNDGPSTAVWTEDARATYINGDDSGTAGTDYPLDNYGMCCANPNTGQFAICFGGQTSEYDSDEVWKFDYRPVGVQGTQANVWVKLTPANAANGPSRRRFAACGFVDDTTFIVFGGYDVDEGKPISDNNVYILDTNTGGTWNSPVEQNTAVSVSGGKMAACYHSGSYSTFMFGGSISNNNEFSSTLYKFNTGNNQFEEENFAADYSPPAVRPSPRSHHNAFSQNGVLYVLNGVNEKGEDLNDMFELDQDENTWSRLSFTGQTWDARHGAVLIESGAIAFVYGGFRSDFQFAIPELVAIDVEEETAVIYDDLEIDDQAGEAPYGIYYGAGFAIQSGTVLVVQGGRNNFDEISPGFHAYNTIQSRWKILYPRGDKKIYDNDDFTDTFARYGNVGLSYNQTHGIIGLGFGSGTAGVSLDFHWIKNIDFTAGTCDIETFKNTSALNSPRDFVRAFPAVTLVGQFIFVCGGRAAPSIAPRPDALCFSVNVNTYDWGTVSLGVGDEAELGYVLSAFTANYIGDIVYMFGGQRSNGIVFSTSDLSDQVLEFQMESTKKCADGIDGQGCILCSKGYENPDCDEAPKGKYIENPSKDPELCPAGTFNNKTGASSSDACLPCPFGFVQPNTGAANCTLCTSDQVCPVGSSTPLAATSSKAALLSGTSSSSRPSFESQPAPYQQAKPPVIWLAVISSVVGVVLLIVAFIVCMGWRANKSRVSHYLREQDVEMLQELYPNYAKNRFGMSVENFYELLVQEKDSLPSNTIDVELANKIFNHIDKYKSANLHEAQFISCIIVAIEYGYMDPFPDTPAVENRKEPSSCSRKIAKFTLEDLDQFEDAHVTAEPGESQKYMRSWYGGIFSLGAVVVLVAVIMLVVIDFVLSSLAETKSLVPWPVITAEYTAANSPGGITITTNIIAEIVVFGIFRSGRGVNTLQEACVTSDGTCNTAQVRTSNIYRGVGKSSNLNATTTCTWNAAQESCAVKFDCKDCGVENSGKLTFLVSSAIAAATIQGKLSIATGIRAATTNNIGTVEVAGGPNEYSTISNFVAPISNKRVLSGFPASTWNYQLAPTYFSSQEYSALVGDKDAVYRDKGYHVHQPFDPVPGNEVPPATFSKFFDAPVAMNLDVDSIPVFVNRAFKQGLVDMFTGLAGAASGVAAAIIIFLNFADGCGENEHMKEAEELQDKEDADSQDREMSKYLEDQQSKNKQPVSKSDFESIRLLMETGLSLLQAAAVVRVQNLHQQNSGNNNNGDATKTVPAVNNRSESNDASAKQAASNAQPPPPNQHPHPNLVNQPPPSQAQLNADDYVCDASIHKTFFWSPQAQLFWHFETNQFFDPKLNAWWDTNQTCWKDSNV